MSMHIFGSRCHQHRTFSKPHRRERIKPCTSSENDRAGRKPYAYFSSPSLRNGFRETARKAGSETEPKQGARCQSAHSKMADYPNPEVYFDDFVFGYFIAARNNDRMRMLAEITERRGRADGFSFKRSSVLRMNYATALSPYRFDSSLSQSPYQEGPWRNDETSSMLYREVSLSAFQYPFSLDIEPFLTAKKHDWGRKTLDFSASSTTSRVIMPVPCSLLNPPRSSSE